MAQQLTAVLLARSLHVSAKALRGWVRENIARFADGKYTPHVYTASEVGTIRKAFAKRTARSTVQKERPASSHVSRKATATKRTARVNAKANVAKATTDETTA